MNIHQIITRYLLAAGVLVLGGALIYFSYAIIYTVDHVDEIIVEIDKTTAHVDRAMNEVEKISALIPPILEQADNIQQKIPMILVEVEASRKLVPGVLDEVEQLRLQIPTVLSEIKAVREELPVVMGELEAYRKLMPDVLAEVAAVREMIPPTLDRAESLSREIRQAGKEASEGAVVGIFSGIIKLPFSMFKGVKNTFTSAELSDSDVIEIRTASEQALQSEIGSKYNWNNPKSSHSGEVLVLSERRVDGNRCRNLRISVNKNNKKMETQDVEACEIDDEWELKF
jgi:surface antigen